jgi:hypothetical protein
VAALWRAAASQGHVRAGFYLGVLYDLGKGVARDRQEAVKWYRAAAKKGHSTAQHNLALCLRDGVGTRRSTVQATRWLRFAAVGGELEAMRNLGYAVFHGVGISKGPSATVLGNYVRFLYHIGERSLPESFIRIAVRLRSGDPPHMLSEGNTVFMLERLLERHVYARPLELKKDRKMQAALLQLLDLLVDAGSSAAFRFRMRDFVTPLPSN